METMKVEPKSVFSVLEQFPQIMIMFHVNVYSLHCEENVEALTTHVETYVCTHHMRIQHGTALATNQYSVISPSSIMFLSFDPYFPSSKSCPE